MTQSPVSKEFGFTAHGTAARVRANVLGPLESIVVDHCVLEFVNPEKLNFRNGTESGRNTPWPITSLSVDLSSRYDIDFYTDSAFGGAQLNKLGGLVFADRHDNDWWTNIHERGHLALFIAPVEDFLKGPAAMMKVPEAEGWSVADAGQRHPHSVRVPLGFLGDVVDHVDDFPAIEVK